MLELLENECAFCGNEKINFLEQSFRFKTSVACGHQVCMTCFRTVFRMRKVVDCPKCGKQMKMSQLRDKSREELEYDKECKIRKEVMESFILVEEDFDSVEAFHDYQEIAEQIVWNRLHEQNTEWAKEKMDWNQTENKVKIARRRAMRAEDKRRFQEEQREEMQRKRDEYIEMLEREAEDRELRRLEREEGIQVKLGARRQTTAAQIRAKRKQEELEKRERLAIQQGYGAQVLRLDQKALWTQAQYEAQPRVDKSKRNEVLKFQNIEPDRLRELRKEAGGLDPTAAALRTRQLILAGLV